MRPRRTTIALALPPMILMIAATGCRQLYNPRMAAPPYPEELHTTQTIDMQVFRDGESITIVNATPRSFRDIDIWINKRFTQPVDELLAGGSVRLSIWDFWDVRGERMIGGGFFATDDPTPVLLVQIQTSDTEPLLGLVTIPSRNEWREQ
jgi:hypothetical protein